MKSIDRRAFLKTVPAVAAVGSIHWQTEPAAMPFGERYIWGITAGILRNLYERVYKG